MGIGKRLLMVTAGILILGFGVNALFTYRHTKEEIVQSLLQQAEKIRGVLMATRRVYHLQFLESEIPLTDKTLGFLPAHALGRISQNFMDWDKSGVRFNNVSDRPRNPNNKADAEEMKAMAFFRGNKEEALFFRPYRDREGKPFYLYARPIWVEPYCLTCHGKREDAPPTIRDSYTTAYDYEAGDLRGILSIKLPSDNIQTQIINKFKWELVYLLGIFGCMFILVLYTVRKYVKQPLFLLHVGMKEIAAGHFERRLSGFDGELAAIEKSFNTMAGEIPRHQKALREAKAEADKANSAKSEFLATMSHDLRTPLNAIVGFSEMMERRTFGPLGDPRYEDYATDIHKSGRILLSLINGILDLSRIEAGRYELSEEPMDTAALIGDAVDLAKGRAEEKNVRLTAETSPDLPMLYADDRAVSQILNNLLSNAVKFTPEGGDVTVSAKVDNDGAVKIKIIDTGIGMSERDIAKAMEPFEQADSTHSRKHEGTGLGLYISRNLMGLHGGTLSIDSEPGKGTTVTVRFPLERTVASRE